MCVMETDTHAHTHTHKETIVNYIDSRACELKSWRLEDYSLQLPMLLCLNS